jgi:hypothetical protein
MMLSGSTQLLQGGRAGAARRSAAPSPAAPTRPMVAARVAAPQHGAPAPAPSAGSAAAPTTGPLMKMAVNKPQKAGPRGGLGPGWASRRIGRSSLIPSLIP